MTTQPEPTVHTIGANVLGRYLVSSSTMNNPAPLLVGFHGYGENAERHLQNLRGIPGVEQWRIAAVQALHPFYQTRTGDVVGSWMTTLDREQAIHDNVTYVRNVVTALRPFDRSDTPLVYAGFSQGVAMAYRAALNTGHRCDGIIALAGDVPPELRDEPADRWPPVLLGCGRADAWYTKEKLQADLAFLDSGPITHKTVIFDGGHEWHPKFSQAAGLFLELVRTGQGRRLTPCHPSTG